MRVPGTPVVKAPKQTDGVQVWYTRPAGAYPASIVVEDTANAGMLYAPYLAITPYVDYTFIARMCGVFDNPSFGWEVQYWGANDDFEPEQKWVTVPGSILTWRWGVETDEVPILYWSDGEIFGSFQYASRRNGSSDGTTHGTEYIADILSVPSTMEIWDCDFLKSSKTFSLFGMNGDQNTVMTYYSGALPYGDNEEGWWFGKNGGTTDSSTGRTCRIDGIAQAFEKPTAPYLLKQVVVDCAVLAVLAPVVMTCKVYKLDEIPPYLDDDTATLPDEPGELIAKGHAMVTPETMDKTGNLLFFTLYGEEDGLEYEITPTIDCAILVVIDGYNEPEMAALQDFSAMICSDIHVDEGFGELAYLKWSVLDEVGNFDCYKWVGLNNFFRSGEMKTGFSIFLSTENPYLAFINDAEDGEYYFPNEGGVMNIDFRSSSPSDDDCLWMSYYGEIDLPDWLTIELTDGMEDGQFNGLVSAKVTADPLPHSVRYRQAIIRFEIPGNYLDYKFMQGLCLPPDPPTFRYDMNQDGKVNISDVNVVIELILEDRGDFNVSHINLIVDYILKH